MGHKQVHVPADSKWQGAWHLPVLCEPEAVRGIQCSGGIAVRRVSEVEGLHLSDMDLAAVFPCRRQRKEGRSKMKYGLLSDVHSNLDALEAVLRSMDSRGVERRVSLGDIVGYGPDVNQCVSLIKREVCLSIMGNHDSVASGRETSIGFNSIAKSAIRWTARQLTTDSAAYLRDLPLLSSISMCSCVHGTAVHPEMWGYLLGSYDASECAKGIETQLCAVGHIHKGQVFFVKEEASVAARVVMTQGVVDIGPALRDRGKVIFSVGSAGQPRDWDPRASWCLLDTDSMVLEYIKVPYDIAPVQERILHAGLHPYLAERLAGGC